MKLYLVKVLRINGHWVISPNWDIYIVPPSKAQGIGLKRRWKKISRGYGGLAMNHYHPETTQQLESGTHNSKEYLYKTMP